MWKKILAVLIIVVMIFGWVISLTDVWGIPSLKDEIKLGLDLSGGVYVVMEAETDKTGEELKEIMNQTQAVIEERVNKMGLSEPIVTIEGENRIRVELPGADNPDDAIETIGTTAQLQFLLADGSYVLGGGQVEKSGVQQDQESGGYAVTLKFDKEGAEAFAQATATTVAGGVTPTIEGVDPQSIVITLDEDIISFPVADKEVISNGEAIITGGFSEEEAMDLSMLINAGALPVNLIEVESSQVGATLGLDALKMSVIAGAIGIALVFILMIAMYRALGFIANIALLIYIPAILWILVAFNAVLTLPGIAGIILSIGMAVDANVIIFARIKEEVSNGKSIRVAVSSGFKRAMTTVIDSQITTIIAGVVLYQFGTGPVKGFAFTLMLGILLSIITAVLITHLYVSFIAESRRFGTKKMIGIKEDNSQSLELKREFSFIKHRKIYYIITVVILVIGLGTGIIRGFNMGIDFTGGTKIQVDMGKEVSVAQIDKVLKENNISNSDVVHYTPTDGKENEGIMIKTTEALDKDERAALLDDMYNEFDIEEGAVESFEQFGPSIGDMLQKNAIKAVLIAALGMLIYIIIRFKWMFGVASIIGVLHDVLIMIAFYGLFHVTINNPFIAGLLTVVGYSINDTIVVFDRIRENNNIMRKSNLETLVDKSINQTLVRSLTTSITTILVLIPLAVLGGESIRQFAVPLIVGVTAGAASSIFICSPIYYQLCMLMDKPKYKGKTKSKPKKKIDKKGDGAVV